jgi:hypothetical protein
MKSIESLPSSSPRLVDLLKLFNRGKNSPEKEPRAAETNYPDTFSIAPLNVHS